MHLFLFCFFFSSRRRHTRSLCDWSSDVCSSDLVEGAAVRHGADHGRHEAHPSRDFPEAAARRGDDSCGAAFCGGRHRGADRKSTRLNSSHTVISYAVFCLKKKKKKTTKKSTDKR